MSARIENTKNTFKRLIWDQLMNLLEIMQSSWSAMSHNNDISSSWINFLKFLYAARKITFIKRAPVLWARACIALIWVLLPTITHSFAAKAGRHVAVISNGNSMSLRSDQKGKVSRYKTAIKLFHVWIWEILGSRSTQSSVYKVYGFLAYPRNTRTASHPFLTVRAVQY